MEYGSRRAILPSHPMGSSIYSGSPAVQLFSHITVICRLCATTKALLAAPKHGWKARADATERCIRARLNMWLGGRETEVCSQVIGNSRKVRPRFVDKTEQSTMRRVQYLVNMGLVSKACQALCSRGTAEKKITPENLAKVQGLFPPGENANYSLPTNLPEVTINQDKVKSVVLKFAKGLSPKPTGLRAEFLQHILNDTKNPSAKQLLKELTNFVNYGLQGGWPPDVYRLLNNGFVVPLFKKDNGIRPLVVGSILRALVGKCLLKEGQGYLWNLSSLQLGLGFSQRSIQTAVNAARSWARDLGV